MHEVEFPFLQTYECTQQSVDEDNVPSHTHTHTLTRSWGQDIDAECQRQLVADLSECASEY